MNFFTELKRRNVFKVGVAYAVVAWLLLQLLDILLPTFEAPAWVMKVIVVLLSVGFVIALFLAWAFELTPEGIKPTSEAGTSSTPSPRITGKLNTVIILVMAAAIGLLLLDNYFLDDSNEPAATEPPAASVAATTAPAALEKSLAVLPFDDISETDYEYFADGLSEELMNKLSQVDDLVVMSRTSSFYFKNSEDSFTEIGEQLDVNYILDGSVQRAGDQVRIRAQLIKAADGIPLWSTTYERAATEIFAVQDEIATEVTTALSVTLSAGEFDIPGMTSDFAVYEEYLKAQRSLYEVSAASVRRAIDQIEAVVQSDPEFAQGWTLLAQIYQGASALLPPDEQQGVAERIEEARQRFSELLPESPLVTMQPIQELMAERRFQEAEQLLLPLLAQDDAELREFRNLYANLLAIVGRNREALAQLMQVRRLDPKNTQLAQPLAMTYFSLGREQEAIVEVSKALADTTITDEMKRIINRVQIYAVADPEHPEAAMELWKQTQAVPLPGSIPALWLAGDTAGAMDRVRALVADPNQALVGRVAWMQFATLMGDYPLALRVLRENGIGFIGGTLWMPYAAPIRKLPEFKDYAREQGLLDYWRATGEWGDYCRPVNDDFECE